VTIVKRVARSDRRRRPPIALYVIAGRAAHKAAANSAQSRLDGRPRQSRPKAIG
jgi:hypothetical protein